jgi:hypothetical protein
MRMNIKKRNFSVATEVIDLTDRAREAITRAPAKNRIWHLDMTAKLLDQAAQNCAAAWETNEEDEPGTHLS